MTGGNQAKEFALVSPLYVHRTGESVHLEKPTKKSLRVKRGRVWLKGKPRLLGITEERKIS